MKLVRFYYIYVLIVSLQACSGGGSYYTIEDLERKKVDVENDIPVESSRKKAIYSYRELLVDDDQEESPEVIRRLGDLRLEENEDLQAVDISSPQVAEKFTTIRQQITLS